LSFREIARIAAEKELRINSEINVPEVRLVGANNEPLGVVAIAEANQMAETAELDLVEIAPTAVPPVCRIMDYGKFKYRESKKRHEAKLKQKQIVIKEVKFRPSTDEGDYKIKLRNLVRFLEEGDKAKITLRFRGREMAHQEFGVRLLQRVKADLDPYAVVEQFPKMEGRQMIMVLSPKKVAVPSKKAKPPAVAGDKPKAEKADKPAQAAAVEPAKPAATQAPETAAAVEAEKK
jgi:translation initiation factor IF-3